MQSQPNAGRQEPLSYNGVHPPRVPDSMTRNAGFTQSAMPYNNTQPLNHGQTSVPIEPGLGRRDDIYGEDVIPGFEFNYSTPESTAGSWEARAPQPPGHSGHVMPSVQYGNVGQGGQGGTNYGPRYDSAANQFLDPTVPFPYLLSGADTAPNNQGAFPVWRLHNVWVSYAVQDELHVTIAFRRIRSP